MAVTTQREAISWWSSTRRTPPTPAASEIIASDWIQARLYPVQAGATSIPVYHNRMRCAVVCQSSAVSAADGLQIEQSNDDAAAKTVHDRSVATVAAGGNGTLLEALISCKYVRIRYLNGAAAPATFSLRAELHDI